MNANLMTKKVELTKKEAKEAGKLNSEVFKELRQLMEMYPGYEIQIKTTTKRKVELKGLDYDFMRDYIQKSGRQDKADVMKKFNTLIAQDKKDGKKGSEHMVMGTSLPVRRDVAPTVNIPRRFVRWRNVRIS